MKIGVKEKLGERGYWRVEVRPVQYNAQRVDTASALRRLIETARVQLRGWDFPHIGQNWDLPDSQSSIGIETDWSSHVELWRAYVSGQFVYRGGVWSDWMDQDHFPVVRMPRQPQRGVGIVDSLWSITEYFEFAARWSQTDAGDDGMLVRVSFRGLNGRELFGDHERRIWSRNYGPSRMESFVFQRELTRAELIADSAVIAIGCASDFLAVFGYEPGPELLREIQSELLNRRGGT